MVGLRGLGGSFHPPISLQQANIMRGLFSSSFILAIIFFTFFFLEIFFFISCLCVFSLVELKISYLSRNLDGTAVAYRNNVVFEQFSILQQNRLFYGIFCVEVHHGQQLKTINIQNWTTPSKCRCQLLIRHVKRHIVKNYNKGLDHGHRDFTQLLLVLLMWWWWCPLHMFWCCCC